MHIVRQDNTTRPDARAFRTAAGKFATGVTVVTAMAGGDGRGMTANAFATVSLDPLLVLVCLSTESRMYRLLRRAGSFAVSVLADHQHDVATYFADRSRTPGPNQFNAVAWTPAPVSGAPVIGGALAWFDCSVYDLVTSGDHTVVVGRVAQLDYLDGEPLVFAGGRYRGLGAPLPPSAARPAELSSAAKS